MKVRTIVGREGRIAKDLGIMEEKRTYRLTNKGWLEPEKNTERPA